MTEHLLYAGSPCPMAILEIMKKNNIDLWDNKKKYVHKNGFSSIKG